MLSKTKLIDLPKIFDERGNLSFVEEYKHIPFKIQRTYWIYDVPGGEIRGGHAFKKQEEIVIALSGSFDVVVHNAIEKKRFHLNRSYHGLYISNGLWRHLENFSTNAVVLILSSTQFDESDYIRDIDTYLQYLKNEK